MHKLIIVITTIFLLTACGSDNKELLVGTWQEIETGSSTVTYNADGTYVSNYDDGTSVSGKWRIDGKKLYIKENGDSEELESTLTTLDEENLVENVADMFETKYTRKK